MTARVVLSLNRGVIGQRVATTIVVLPTVNPISSSTATCVAKSCEGKNDSTLMYFFVDPLSCSFTHIRVHVHHT